MRRTDKFRSDAEEANHCYVTNFSSPQPNYEQQQRIRITSSLENKQQKKIAFLSNKTSSTLVDHKLAGMTDQSENNEHARDYYDARISKRRKQQYHHCLTTGGDHKLYNSVKLRGCSKSNMFKRTNQDFTLSLRTIVALVLCCTVLLFLDFVQSVNHDHNQVHRHHPDHIHHSINNNNGRLLAKRRAHAHTHLTGHRDHLGNSFKDPSDANGLHHRHHHSHIVSQATVSEQYREEENLVLTTVNPGFIFDEVDTVTATALANHDRDARSRLEKLNQIGYGSAEDDDASNHDNDNDGEDDDENENSNELTTTATTTMSGSNLQVPEQLPIVVSTSDNSYVSASPVDSGDARRKDLETNDDDAAVVVTAETTEEGVNVTRTHSNEVTDLYGSGSGDEDDEEVDTMVRTISPTVKFDDDSDANDHNDDTKDHDEWVDIKSFGIDAYYYTESAHIIKTKESINLGATFLNYTIVTSLNACLVECWITDSCDTAIYQETPVDFSSHLPVESTRDHHGTSLEHHQNILALSQQHRRNHHHQVSSSPLPFGDSIVERQNRRKISDNEIDTSDHNDESADDNDGDVNTNEDSRDYLFLDEEERPKPRQRNSNKRHARRGISTGEMYQQDDSVTVMPEQVISSGFYLCYLFECSKADGFKCQFSPHNYYTSSTKRRHPATAKVSKPYPRHRDDSKVKQHEIIYSGHVGHRLSYSRIRISPSNHHRLIGRYHDSHSASIRIGLEEHNYAYERRDPQSAIIAIGCGIVVTGILIMIVGHKMRYIRERLAYKSRRRSLVPDADFLINTINLDT